MGVECLKSPHAHPNPDQKGRELDSSFQSFYATLCNGNKVSFEFAFDFEFRSGRCRLCAAENGSEMNLV